MATMSFFGRLRALVRRTHERFVDRVWAPALFRLSVKNQTAGGGAERTYAFRSGFSLTVPAGSTNINPHVDVWVKHVYDHPLLRWNEAKTIVDIGAHIGAFSLYCAKKAPQAKVWAYEPDPVTYGYLERNIRDNNLQDTIAVRCCAVGGNSGTATLNILPGRSEANSLYRALDGSQAVTVPVTTLADAFAKEGIGRCDILKLNAEGVEYEILYGLPQEQLKNIGAIVMNYHLFVKSPRATPEALTAYLRDSGFAVSEQGKRIMVAIRR